MRNTHAAALRNLRHDNELFALLKTIGRVTEERRAASLEREAA
ncbi:MAG: hypothetical protein WKF96_10760 [Solirubrobacteraceae bacterium]